MPAKTQADPATDDPGLTPSVQTQPGVLDAILKRLSDLESSVAAQNSRFVEQTGKLNEHANSLRALSGNQIDAEMVTDHHRLLNGFTRTLKDEKTGKAVQEQVPGLIQQVAELIAKVR